MVTNGLVQKNPIVLGLEPLHAILLLELVGTTDLANLQLAILHAAAGAGQMHVEIHAIDASSRVVFDAQVDVLLGAGTVEAAGTPHQKTIAPPVPEKEDIQAFPRTRKEITSTSLTDATGSPVTRMLLNQKSIESIEH